MQEEEGSNSELPIFEVDKISADTPDDCIASNCLACGLSGDFCTKCQEGYVREDGQCVTNCKHGFFAAQGTCFKCSPLCETCSDTANQCNSCPKKGNQYSAFTKLLPEQRMCVVECPPGTFEEPNSGHCLSCGILCNTCKGDADTCTSCFHSKTTLKDLYLFKNNCIEDCPRMTKKNLVMHRCDALESKEIFAFDNWPITLTLFYTALAATIFALSRIVSRWQDRPWDLLAGLLSVMECMIKWSLWVTLW